MKKKRAGQVSLPGPVGLEYLDLLECRAPVVHQVDGAGDTRVKGVDGPENLHRAVEVRAGAADE